MWSRTPMPAPLCRRRGMPASTTTTLRRGMAVGRASIASRCRTLLDTALPDSLVDGMILRAITRTTGVSINTVTTLLVDAGKACFAYENRAFRDLVQVDEIW